MMKIKTPTLPESIKEGKIIKWHKKVGDAIYTDDLIVEIETDKVVLEIVAEEDGIIEKILIKEGSVVQEEQELGLIKLNSAENIIKEVLQNKPIKNYEETLKDKPKEKVETQVEKVIQKKQEDYIIKNDTKGRLQESIAMNAVRKTIARKLHTAKQKTAMVTTFNEVDMSKIISIRSKYKEKFYEKYGVNLGFMSFFVKAAIEALKKHPNVNAYIQEDKIIYNAYCDISIAISSKNGLFVPVLRNAHEMSLHNIEAKIKEFAEKAEKNSLSVEDISGGTFTISNGGVFGSLLSTPILNYPQSAILGMHTIQKRAVVIEDKIVIRPMMYLALSYDHQIIDGKESVTFLKTIKHSLEDPYRILIKI